MKAREYFEQVREIVREVERSREMLAVLMTQSELKAQSYEPAYGGGFGDSMRKVDSAIAFERRLKQRIVEASDVVDEATALLYGAHDKGGLAKAKGMRYADVLCMAYCQNMPWGEVAEVMRCSPQWCRELSAAAFRYIDAVGFARLKNND